MFCKTSPVTTQSLWLKMIMGVVPFIILCAQVRLTPMQLNNSPFNFSRAEALSVLLGMGPAVMAEHLLLRSEIDTSLHYQVALMVFASRLPTTPSEADLIAFFEGLHKLCMFEAEWRENDYGWSLFLGDVVSAVKKISNLVSLKSFKEQLQEIIQAAETSSSQMDDCYSCGIEIEKLECLLQETTQ